MSRDGRSRSAVRTGVKASKTNDVVTTMHNLTKWAFGSLLVCSGVWATSQSTPLTQWAQEQDGAQTTELVAVAPQYSNAIETLEHAIERTRFNSQNRVHSLRLKRIIYYLSEAREFEQRNWHFNRDDSLERANAILRHHRMKTGQGHAL